MLRAFLFTTLLLFSLVCTSSAEEQRFGGVGLQVVPTIDGDLVVLRVLEKSPAAKEGMRPGDMIYQVDDFSLKGSDFGQVVSEYLWGPEGSKVVLHYLRPGVTGEQTVTLERAAIDPPAVSSGS